MNENITRAQEIRKWIYGIENERQELIRKKGGIMPEAKGPRSSQEKGQEVIGDQGLAGNPWEKKHP